MAVLHRLSVSGAGTVQRIKAEMQADSSPPPPGAGR